MKKNLLIACCLISLLACADEKRVIEFTALPKASQQLLTQFANPQDILLITQDGTANWADFEVKFSDRSEWEFDAKGQLEQVEVPAGVPAGVLPEKIVQYIQAAYPKAVITQYAKDRRDQEVELNNGLELKFDLQGQLLRVK